MFQRIRWASLAAAGASLALLLGTAGTADASPNAVRVAVLYEHHNFEGESVALYADTCRGNPVPQYQNAPEGWNDRVTSMQIFVSCDIVIHEHGFQSGRSARLKSGSYANLGNSHGFNDTISSFSFLRPWAGVAPGRAPAG
ncbi:beta/gamma crystallin domain-containing protein [Streptomyces clavuligerus]|uniref:Beta/gamma crystallin 'Greek key' domain-containing protein n=1 Tax=Streptomyces clavuligerus TaxID=1901 RepID=B5GW37_STRCL|nr:beta/gamma crystallin domain-containing protein [Streptomyces clavuligerus]EDY50533.1 hypothetical protein SSCG_03680 [Streptomyces clavuligerus]EFG03567.1 Hypothetical protein SCLAV_p0076 [Streptomyces clavuligerus]MBY6307851.1 hypothetical protein [Streptomyces clavuligerus]QCS09596.1 hypothetical protein CRV15_28515 [Streptomyces clavuligerus]QPJ98354.1 hypothetical protein GE265_35805 [Streptomyces clavuligerus]